MGERKKHGVKKIERGDCRFGAAVVKKKRDKSKFSDQGG